MLKSSIYINIYLKHFQQSVAAQFREKRVLDESRLVFEEFDNSNVIQVEDDRWKIPTH